MVRGRFLYADIIRRDNIVFVGVLFPIRHHPIHCYMLQEVAGVCISALTLGTFIPILERNT